MDERQRRVRSLVAEIGVEADELTRRQHPLVDDGARGEARDDELGARLQLGDPPDDVELALEGVGVETAGRGDEELPDPRRRLRGDRAQAARIDGHVAPVDDGLALGGDDPLEELLEHRRTDGILRQEAHPDAVRARLRQRAAEFAAEQRVR